MSKDLGKSVGPYVELLSTKLLLHLQIWISLTQVTWEFALFHIDELETYQFCFSRSCCTCTSSTSWKIFGGFGYCDRQSQKCTSLMRRICDHDESTSKMNHQMVGPPRLQTPPNCKLQIFRNVFIYSCGLPKNGVLKSMWKFLEFKNDPQCRLIPFKVYINHTSLTVCSTGIHHKERESARVGMWQF